MIGEVGDPTDQKGISLTSLKNWTGFRFEIKGDSIWKWKKRTIKKKEKGEKRKKREHKEEKKKERQK